MNGTTPLSLVKQEGKRALENTLTCFLFQRNFCLIFNQQELMMKNRVPFWFREKKSSSREWSTQTIFWCKMLLRTQKSVQVYRRCIAVFGRSFDWNMTEMAALICRICLKYHLQFTDITKPFFPPVLTGSISWKAKSWFFIHWNPYSFALSVYYKRLNMNFKLINDKNADWRS